MRHFVQDDPHPLKDIIQDVMNTSSSLPKRCTKGPLAQLNSMVSTWTTNGKATTAGSLLVFEDNVGEDGLCTQSTYKVNIDCPYYKEAIAPNLKVLNKLKPSKEQLEIVIVKKPFLAVIVKAKASILILPKFKPKMRYFCLLMILN
jgi:hypothetical protein